METNTFTNNTVWFPFTVAKVWVLVALTMFIEVGLMNYVIGCINITENDRVLIINTVFIGNFITGFIGYVFVKIKERLEN